jgi:ribosomal protein L37AE/L43A
MDTLERKRVCEKCHGAGVIKDKNGIHTCYDCLQSDQFDQHGKPKDTGIRL